MQNRYDLDTARLRRAFKYPDDGDGKEPEAMDEQEQEKMIDDMLQRDKESTDFYRAVLTGLTLFTAAVYFLISVLMAVGMAFTHLPGGKGIVFLGGLSALLSASIIFDLPKQRPVFSQVRRLANLVPLEHLDWAFFGVSGLIGLVLLYQVFMPYGAWPVVMPILAELVMAGLSRLWLMPINVKLLEDLKYEYRGA